MTRTSYASSGRYVFVVPDQCTSILATVAGAGGGSGTGGSGGSVTGTLHVTPGQVLYLYLGGAGGAPTAGASAGGAGGYNGGGPGGDSAGSGGYPGYGGGGLSEIRLGTDDAAHAVLIGSGGGGSGRSASVAVGGNGYGGTPSSNGSDGSNGATTGAGGVGRGGTQTAGGAAGTPGTGASNTALAGSSRQGGKGSTHAAANLRSGGGGGAGLFGGGGGGGSSVSDSGGGGGGSSWASTDTSKVTSPSFAGGSYAQIDGTVVLTYNVAPNTPITTAPDNNASFDSTLPLVTTWNFDDPDASDTQSVADVRWRLGSGSWNTIGLAAMTASTYTFATHTFDSYIGQPIEWQVRVYDAAGAVSAWSDSSYFYPRTAPSAPSFIDTPQINSRTPRLNIATASTIAAYQIQVGSDSSGAFGSVLSDTERVSVSSSPATTLVANAADYGYTNHTFYHLRVRYQHFSGVWSPWLDSGALEALVNAPRQPTLVLTPFVDSSTAGIRVDIFNPGGDGIDHGDGIDPYPPNGNDVFRTNLDDGSDEVRIAVNVAVNGSFVDTTPASQCTYRYRVEAHNANTYVSSA